MSSVDPSYGSLQALQRELSAVRAQLRESRMREAQARLLATTDVRTPLETLDAGAADGLSGASNAFRSSAQGRVRP
ncbi:MAG TPA: hypothetical protein VGE10_13285 [Zeimonas sp.]